MKIREATSEDIPELVDMYIDLVNIAYPTRRIAPQIIFYEIVVRWIKNKHRVMVTYDETTDEITGFSYTGYNNGGGLTETLLDAEITYVKEHYRNTRAAYMIYNDVFDFAKEQQMGIMSTSTPESSKILIKRFGAENTFLHWEVTTKHIKSLK